MIILGIGQPEQVNEAGTCRQFPSSARLPLMYNRAEEVRACEGMERVRYEKLHKQQAGKVDAFL